jgi:ribosomal protein L11 methyltransferase
LAGEAATELNTSWTEITASVPTGELELALSIMRAVTDSGFYIEDYSNLEEDVLRIAHVDLIEDALLEKDRVTAVVHMYASPDENPAELAASVEARLSAARVDARVGMASIREEDWANNWKKHFKPIRVGQRIIIKPEWETLADGWDAPASGGAPVAGDGDSRRGDGTAAPAERSPRAAETESPGERRPRGAKIAAPSGRAPRDVVVSIEPGMAFGTGSHASTKLCLELIERYAKPSSRVLDVGTGSGILSIASVLLGASSALGVDIDEYAVKVARRNAALNGICDRAAFMAGDLTDGASGHFDLIIANIVADVIIRLLGSVGRFLAPGGALICSGIIDDREADVLEAISGHGFRAAEIRRDGVWTAVAAKARANGAKPAQPQA